MGGATPLGARAGADLGGRCRRRLAGRERGWLHPCPLAEAADQRRAENPEDAIGVYRRHVEDVIAGKDKRAYAEAVRLIDETMRALYTECGQPEDFDAYVEEVRTTHKPKRNLMKLMTALDPVKSTS